MVQKGIKWLPMLRVSPGCCHIVSSCHTGCVLELRVLFQAHVVACRIQFHWVVGCKSPCSCWPSASAHTQLLDTISNSFARGSLRGPITPWQLTSSIPQRISLRFAKVESYTMQCNPITFIIFYQDMTNRRSP